MIRGTARRTGNALLWVTAALGAAAILATSAMWLTGTRPLVIQSGSMAPTYDVRSVVLVHRVDPSDVRAGDVVVLTLPTGRKLLHRVTDVDDTAAGPSLQTKGDANREVDPHRTLLPADGEAWRAGASVPMLGGLALILRTPAAGFALGLAVLGPLALGRRRPMTAARAAAA